jgi:hypothetical protein
MITTLGAMSLIVHAAMQAFTSLAFVWPKLCQRARFCSVAHSIVLPPVLYAHSVASRWLGALGSHTWQGRGYQRYLFAYF